MEALLRCAYVDRALMYEDGCTKYVYLSTIIYIYLVLKYYLKTKALN